jgi:O-antigen ligase
VSAVLRVRSASWRATLALCGAALPWLNPLARGPSPGVAPWLVSAVCGIALWLLAATGVQRPAMPRRLLAAAAALVAWGALAHLPLRPEIAMLAAGLLLILLAAGFARDAEIAHGLQAGFLVAAAVSAVIGLAQYFGISAWFAPWMNIAEAGEAYANLRQPNQYATLCWIGGAVVLFGSLDLRRRAASALLVLFAVGCAASVSRTGIVQQLVLALLAALWRGPRRRERLQLCAVAAIAYFAAAVLLPVLLEALTGAMPARTLWGRLGGGQACSSRLVLWSNVLHLIAQKPLAGWGWGELDFAHFETLYGGARFCDILDNAHNLPLHLAVELGLPAALLVCGWSLWWAWRQRPWQEEEAPRQLAWAVLALILLHSLLEYPLWYGPFQIAFGAALGWLLVPQEAPVDRPASAAPFAFAALLFAATGYAAWDYVRVCQIYLQPDQRLAPWTEDTLGAVRRSWLFSGQARFADVTLQVPDRGNAATLYPLALDVLHYSPEPRVIERAIEGAALLGRDAEAVQLLARYRAAFPRDYEAWRRAQGLPAR